MTDQAPISKNTQKDTLVLRIYFALIILGGLLTLGSLLRIPTEGKNAVFLGLSAERLMMVAAILIMIIGAGGISTVLQQQPFPKG